MSRPLRVGGVPEHFNLPWRLAVEDGAFAAAGLDVEWTEIGAGTGEMTRRLREDELDLAVVLTEGAVADILRHDASWIVKVFVSSPLTWGIHVAADGPLRRLADMRGKRVAISRHGSGSHLIAIVDAAARGWPTDDMSFVVIDDLDGARRALAAGQADVFLWEKHMTQPLVDSGEFRRLGVREVPWPAFVVAARREVLARDTGDIRKALDIVARYARNFRRRAGAAQQVAETYGIRPDSARAWLSEVRWSTGYRCPVAGLRRASTALAAQGVVDPGPFDQAGLWATLR
ncbi:PhnD/SsuA/transferrin family substrate-binding protein [Marinihelvus fidelis]|uniref:PhnD/SsuA/transferrin family substrate-binding protein n=1 Tax=Marinihelvus fidelis TaxID=2613842 RepID=A0A5N0TEL1_9GAMM|nr:PhnD/SsuA/transferrin family substrate-binding protein [Marinihelvus fidelis]KAA9133543.1 PhnD/SsuA/transferrin family substrate-binding protein [Marinihelvus fidelis]